MINYSYLNMFKHIFNYKHGRLQILNQHFSPNTIDTCFVNESFKTKHYTYDFNVICTHQMNKYECVNNGGHILLLFCNVYLICNVDLYILN